MEKELIILAYYINISGFSRQQAEQLIVNIMEQNENMYDDVSDTKTIKHYYVPIEEGQTRIECIYPFNNNSNNGLDEDLVKLYRLISNINNNELNDLINNIEDKIIENYK